jgi:hypothetical protein
MPRSRPALPLQTWASAPNTPGDHSDGRSLWVAKDNMCVVRVCFRAPFTFNVFTFSNLALPPHPFLFLRFISSYTEPSTPCHNSNSDSVWLPLSFSSLVPSSASLPSNEPQGWMGSIPAASGVSQSPFFPASGSYPLQQQLAPQQRFTGRTHESQLTHTLPAHSTPLPAAMAWGNGRGREGGREKKSAGRKQH